MVHLDAGCTISEGKWSIRASGCTISEVQLVHPCAQMKLFRRQLEHLGAQMELSARVNDSKRAQMRSFSTGRNESGRCARSGLVEHSGSAADPMGGALAGEGDFLDPHP